MSSEYKIIIRFLITGAVNTGFGYGVYSLFVFLMFPLWLAVCGSLIAGVIFNYFTYGRYVFRVRSSFHFVLFFVFYCAIGLLNYGLLRWMLSYNFSSYFAQLILLPVIALTSYAGMKWFVFGNWTNAYRQTN